MGWTEAEIGDLSGRRAIVTGASSGLGEIVAGELARAGAQVVAASRDRARGEEAIGRMADRGVPAERLEFGELDLASLASVREFAAVHQDPVDLLVNNAGVMHTPERKTDDGFELQLGTNHLGPFALTGLLLPALLRTEAPRVVTVSSILARDGKLDFDDLMLDKGYDSQRAYGNSKLANQLFAFELQRRSENAEAPLKSMAAHPGYSATNLQFAGPQMKRSLVRLVAYRFANTFIAQPATQGARAILWAATGDHPGGTYFGFSGPGQLRGPLSMVPPVVRARDMDTAAKLWSVSEELTGVSFEWPRA